MIKTSGNRTDFKRENMQKVKEVSFVWPKSFSLVLKCMSFTLPCNWQILLFLTWNIYFKKLLILQCSWIRKINYRLKINEGKDFDLYNFKTEKHATIQQYSSYTKSKRCEKMSGTGEGGISKPCSALDCAGHTIPHREGFGIRTAEA